MPDEVTVLPDNTLVRQPPVIERPTGMLALLDRALEMRLPAAELGAWMDLYERSEATKAKAAYAASMAACQGKLKGILKTKQNRGTNSNYAPGDEIDAQIRPITTECGFSMSFTEIDAKKPDHTRYRLDVDHAAGHSKSFELELHNDGFSANGKPLSMNATQAGCSTQAYLRRGLVKNAFNLYETDEDRDGQWQSDLIGPGQIEVLNDLIERTNTDFKRFLAWAKIEQLDQMRVADFEKARQTLAAKLKQNGGAK